MQTTPRQRWGTILWLVGVAAGLFLALSAVWGDFEATSYFRTGATYGQFGGLHCPILMGRPDVAELSAAFHNPTDKAIEPYYQVRVSGATALRKIEQQIKLEPHSSHIVRWTVDAKDVDLGWFVLSKITVLPFAGNPTREATCGMIVFNIGGMTGSEILGLGLLISLAGIVAGLMLREGIDQIAPGKETTLRNGMRAGAFAVLLAMLTGFLGVWILGLLFSAITILLVVILFRIANG